VTSAIRRALEAKMLALFGDQFRKKKLDGGEAGDEAEEARSQSQKRGAGEWRDGVFTSLTQSEKRDRKAAAGKCPCLQERRSTNRTGTGALLFRRPRCH
jgi:hypothetical protein